MRAIVDKDESWDQTMRDAFFCISCCFKRREEKMPERKEEEERPRIEEDPI
jgi:hypothetical protein